MKNVRSILSAFAFVFAIGIAVATNAGVIFTSEFGINPDTGICGSATLVDTVPCGTTNHSKGTCSVQFPDGIVAAYNNSLCSVALYRQQ